MEFLKRFTDQFLSGLLAVPITENHFSQHRP